MKKGRKIRLPCSKGNYSLIIGLLLIAIGLSGCEKDDPATYPDVRVPVEKQLLDNVTGVWVSHKINNEWSQPELIISQFAGEPVLDDAGNVHFVHHFYENNVMIEADIYVSFIK